MTFAGRCMTYTGRHIHQTGRHMAFTGRLMQRNFPKIHNFFISFAFFLTPNMHAYKYFIHSSYLARFLESKTYMKPEFQIFLASSTSFYAYIQTNCTNHSLFGCLQELGLITSILVWLYCKLGLDLWGFKIRKPSGGFPSRSFRIWRFWTRLCNLDSIEWSLWRTEGSCKGVAWDGGSHW